MIDQMLVSGIARAVLGLQTRGGSVYYFPKKEGDANGAPVPVQELEAACQLRLVTKDYHRSRTLYVLTRLGWSVRTPPEMEALVVAQMAKVAEEEQVSDAS